MKSKAGPIKGKSFKGLLPGEKPASAVAGGMIEGEVKYGSLEAGMGVKGSPSHSAMNHGHRLKPIKGKKA